MGFLQIIKRILNESPFLYKRYDSFKRNIARKNGNKIRMKEIRLDKEEYFDIKKKYDLLIEKMQSEIVARNDKWIYSDKKERFDGYTLLSFNGDNMGKTLKKNGKIYRGIYREQEDNFIKLWESGILQVLIKYSMIPNIVVTRYSNSDYSIILEIEKIPITTYSVWSYSMVKDACILISILKNILEKNGFTLQDGHFNNISFNKGNPVFFDIGSFVPMTRTSFQVETVFVGGYRLLFQQLGNCLLSRNSIYDESNNSIWVKPYSYDVNVREYQSNLQIYNSNFALE